MHQISLVSELGADLIYLSVDLKENSGVPIEGSDSGTSIMALTAAMGNMFVLPLSDPWAEDAAFDESFGTDGDEQPAAPSDNMVFIVMG